MKYIYFRFAENMQRSLKSNRIFFLLILVFIVSFPVNAQMTATGETRHIPAGSVIIDMGVMPQTVNNGLKPYGLVYALVINEKVPVIWSISSTKVKDGADFTVDGREFKGGTFIIEKDYANLPEVQKILNGVKGVPIYDDKDKLKTTEYFGPTVVIKYTTKSDVTVPVYKEIRSFTNWTFDTTNGKIADGYLGNAGIPLSARQTALPNALTDCHDIFVLPHADPEWKTHGRLYDWVREKDNETNPTGNGGWLWSGCHAPNEGVGIENMYNTATGMSYQRTNFLTDRIDGGVIGTTASLGKSTPSKNPWHYAYPNDVPMQFMGKVDWVLMEGSGPGYLPTTNHKWRDGTKRLIWDESTDKNGVTTVTSLVIYGYAYDKPKNGIVMYEAGHSHDGTDAASVAAQRIFLNFLFEGSSRKLPEFTSVSPELDKLTLYEGQKIDFSALAKGHDNVTITYYWNQTSLNGTFSSTDTPSTTYTAELLPTGTLSKQGTITVLVADPCGRSNVLTYPITIIKNIKNYWHGTIDNDWEKLGNWTGGFVPDPEEDIEFATEENNPTVSDKPSSGPAKEDLHLDKDRNIGDLINKSDKDLIVTLENELVIHGKVHTDNTGGIVVQADPNKPAGTLIFDKPGDNSSVDATVQFYNKAYECADCGFYRKQWQYFGVPVKSAEFPFDDVAGDETVNRWDETYNGDKWQPTTGALSAFVGYQITNDAKTEPTEVYNFEGKLNVGDASVALTKTPSVNYSGTNLVSNSYTAAIPISTDAMTFPTGAEQTVYLFNTGTRDQWRKLNGQAINQDGYKSGQYLAVPLNLGGTLEFPDRIPSTHAFMILTEGSGDLHINYMNLTKNTEVNRGDGTEIVTRSVDNNSASVIGAQNNNSQLPSLVMDVIGEESADRVWIFKKQGSSHNFNNGWDGRKMLEDGIAQLYVNATDDSKLQVATVPELNSVSLGFIADTDGKYTFEFAQMGQLKGTDIYLYDAVTGTTHEIEDGKSYSFTAKKGESPGRFRLSSKDNGTFLSADEALLDVSTKDGAIMIVNASSNVLSAFVYDSNGAFVQRVEVDANGKASIKSGLVKGMYMVRLQNSEVNDVRRVTVE